MSVFRYSVNSTRQRCGVRPALAVCKSSFLFRHWRAANTIGGLAALADFLSLENRRAFFTAKRLILLTNDIAILSRILSIGL